LKVLTDNLTQAYATAGVFISGRNQYDGMILIMCAEQRAQEMALALSHNKQIFELVERVFAQGDITKCIVGHGLMVYAILANHNRMPRNDILLQQLGYAPGQVFAKFNVPTQEAQSNGYQPPAQEEAPATNPIDASVL
jgi:hypothetical protein